ncbi:MAG: DegV family protein [Clostridiales bacterium]|nr:DegV family protein [Clostridiales bacterium]
MSIRITTDSTSDLGENVQKRGIGVLPLSVILGPKTYKDGIDITPQDIFAYVEKTKELPKTAAPSIGDYEEFFRPYVENGDTVIHFNISAKSSSSHSSALGAAKSFAGKVFVIDSKALSSGQGLLVMKACDLVEEGKSAEEIVEIINSLRSKVNTSFVPDRLDYLFKGGRCSRMQMYSANLLKIHPVIHMVDGQLEVKRKVRGSMDKCISSYIQELYEEYQSYDKTRCFITHSNADESLVAVAKAKVKELFLFDEVLETKAGSIVTSHCGRNTLGLLFIAE